MKVIYIKLIISFYAFLPRILVGCGRDHSPAGQPGRGFDVRHRHWRRVTAVRILRILRAMREIVSVSLFPSGLFFLVLPLSETL